MTPQNVPNIKFLLLLGDRKKEFSTSNGVSIMSSLIVFAKSPYCIVYGANDSKYFVPAGNHLKLKCNNETATLEYLDKIIFKQEKFTEKSVFEIKLKKIGKFA